MNFFSKPLLLIFSTFLAIGTTVFSLCAESWGWYEYGGNSNFAPEAYVQDESYRQLFYSADMFYSNEDMWSDSHDNAHSRRFETSIIADWKGYLKSKISDKELQYYIFSDSSATDLKSITKAISSKDAKSKWSKKYNLSDTTIRQFFLFLKLAKSVEPYCNNDISWNYDSDSAEEPNAMSVEQAKTIESVYQSVKDPFLKNRYWMLTMKSYFYSENRNECVTFFNKTQSALTKDEAYFRGLSYVAGVAYKNKKYETSNFMYALVFDNCPKLRTVATYCFHPQNDSDFNKSLALAKSNTQKSALWALYGYYADEVEAINKIYQLEPANKHLDYLLTRALNIAENSINSNSWEYNYGSEASFKQTELNQKLYNTVIQIAKANNTKSPYLWNIAAGYFEVIRGNNANASNYFSLAEKSIPSTKLAQEQLKLFKTFNDIASVKKMDEKSQTKLMPMLKWLYSLRKEENSVKHLRVNFLNNWSKTYIASLYKKQGNEVFSELFFRKKDFYLNPQRMEKMQKYLEGNNNSDWDIFAQSLYSVSLKDIYEFKAIKLAYNNNIKEAIIQMNKSEDNKDAVLLGNPFNGNIKDCNDCDHSAFQKTKYSKIEFLHKLHELQEIVAKGGDTFTDNLLLGNAFYNMSFYGNARVFYNNKIIDQTAYYIEDTYSAMLDNDKMAEKYYLQALAVAKTDEQKAKATYLLTKIERNAFYSSSAHKPYEIDYISFKGYKTLKEKYSHTKYYQEVINECGYFRNYAD
ncbi:hypothetical protein [Flavobacterium sp. H122]|uniref:hypothetical protein n=1 Tax=Flavobacterium sp. H122 TaxID=2529860 RepID=UPI0010AA89FF|nr:hypothetical protein [Flavobacterium sp. H122]